MDRRAAVAFGLVLAAAEARAGEPALAFMRGLWRGDGHALLLDTERMQGNVETDRPFQRDSVILRNIAGRMVMFDVGAHRYIGLFEGDELQLSGDGIDKPVRMRRIPRR